jgi:peptidoglycan L-alanyl-D-glutamate endopeptidase CwlK
MSSAGYYKGSLDGKWSTAMDKAEIDFYNDYDKLRGKLGSFDPRSEKAIATLLPSAQQAARKFMTLAKTKFDVKRLSGLRTYAEQNASLRRAAPSRVRLSPTHTAGFPTTILGSPGTSASS